MSKIKLTGIEADLHEDEALRLKPYDDATGKELKPGDVVRGNISIGIGRNLSGVGISEDEVMVLLRNDIAKAEAGLLQAFPWHLRLSEVRRDVLINMAFNMGISRLSEFVDFLDALKRGEYERAAVEMLDSKWARQVGVRAQRLAQKMREG